MFIHQSVKHGSNTHPLLKGDFFEGQNQGGPNCWQSAGEDLPIRVATALVNSDLKPREDFQILHRNHLTFMVEFFDLVPEPSYNRQIIRQFKVY